jgi:hypothetical protein
MQCGWAITTFKVASIAKAPVYYKPLFMFGIRML